MEEFILKDIQRNQARSAFKKKNMPVFMVFVWSLPPQDKTRSKGDINDLNDSCCVFEVLSR